MSHPSRWLFSLVLRGFRLNESAGLTYIHPHAEPSPALLPPVHEARLSRTHGWLSAQLVQLGTRDQALRMLLVLVAYVACGRAGLATIQSGQVVSLIWPATGVALAALVRFGLGVWPAVWLGALIVEMATGASWWVAGLLAFGNTLGPAIAAWVLHRDGLHPELNRRRDLWLFGAVGIGFAMLITASNGAFWLAASGVVAWADAPRTWATWWLGDAMGALVVGVPLLTLSRESLRQAFAQWRWVPTGLLATGTLASAAIAAALATNGHVAQSPLFFAPHLLLCWMAARSGLFAASATALLLIGGTALMTTLGLGPFLRPDAGQTISMMVGYIGSLLAIPLITTALTGEIATNERRWQLALDTSHIGVGEWDLTNGRIEFSPRWLALLGYSSQDFGDHLQAFWGLVHPDDVAAVQQAFEPLRASGVINCRAECRMTCRDGSWRLFELHALVAERSANGAPVRIINTARDVSDAQAARDRQDLTQSVFQHLHEGLLITDPEHRVLEVNPTYSQITGKSVV